MFRQKHSFRFSFPRLSCIGDLGLCFPASRPENAIDLGGESQSIVSWSGNLWFLFYSQGEPVGAETKGTLVQKASHLGQF